MCRNNKAEPKFPSIAGVKSMLQKWEEFVLLLLLITCVISKGSCQRPWHVVETDVGSICNSLYYATTSTTGAKRLCCMCPPGQHLVKDCNPMNHDPNSTVCKDCRFDENGAEQSFMPESNNKTSCIQSRRSCDGLVYTIFKLGSSVENNRCVCQTGSYSSHDPEISGCKLHLKCPPGYGVDFPGNSTHDVTCTQCGPETFSNHSSSTNACEPFKNCKPDERKVFHGSAERNVECEKQSNKSVLVPTMKQSFPTTNGPDSITSRSQSKPKTEKKNDSTEARQRHGDSNIPKGLWALFAVALPISVGVWHCWKRRRKKGTNSNIPEEIPMLEKGKNEEHSSLPNRKDSDNIGDGVKASKNSRLDGDSSEIPTIRTESKDIKTLGLKADSLYDDEIKIEQTSCVSSTEQIAPNFAAPYTESSPDLKQKNSPKDKNFEDTFKRKGFKISYNPDKDGNCQFAALGFLLGQDHMVVRQDIVNHLDKDCNYEHFLDKNRYSSWPNFLRKMNQSGEYGDHLTLLAASKLYNKRFRIIQTSNEKSIYIPDIQDDVEACLLGHIDENDGMHYVCLEPLDRRIDAALSQLPSSDDRVENEDDNSEQSIESQGSSAASNDPLPNNKKNNTEYSSLEQLDREQHGVRDAMPFPYHTRPPQLMNSPNESCKNVLNSELTSNEKPIYIPDIPDDADVEVCLLGHIDENDGMHYVCLEPLNDTGAENEDDNPVQPIDSQGTLAAMNEPLLNQNKKNNTEYALQDENFTSTPLNNETTVTGQDWHDHPDLQVIRELFQHEDDIKYFQQVSEFDFFSALESKEFCHEMLYGKKGLFSKISTAELKLFIRQFQLLEEVELEDIETNYSESAEKRRRFLVRLQRKMGRDLTPKYLLQKSCDYDLRCIYDTLCEAFKKEFEDQIAGST